MGYLRAPTAHEKLVKPAAYILGEFGHLIANEDGASPVEQFQALHSKINYCSASTRALLLSTYIKWCVSRLLDLPLFETDSLYLPLIPQGQPLP